MLQRLPLHTAAAFRTSMAPSMRKPGGELRIPFIKCQAPPPTAPMPKAPPMSSMMRSGHGSRWCSTCPDCCWAILLLLLDRDRAVATSLDRPRNKGLQDHDVGSETQRNAASGLKGEAPHHSYPHNCVRQKPFLHIQASRRPETAKELR